MAESSSPFTSDRAGDAFLVSPPGQANNEGEGPGVLVLHSWWGLNDWTRDFCRRIAAEGYTVVAPDLLAGATPSTREEGDEALSATDPNELAGLVMSSAHATRAASADGNKPIAVIGLSMGASLGLWVSTKLPVAVGAVVSFYGSQSIDFDDSTAKYQSHHASEDHMVSEDDRVTTEAFIRMGGQETDFHMYESTKHWFFEAGDTYDEEAAELAWSRMIPFLAQTIGPGRSNPS